MDGFCRIHHQELNHAGVNSAKNDLSGADCSEIAIGLPNLCGRVPSPLPSPPHRREVEMEGGARGNRRGRRPSTR